MRHATTSQDFFENKYRQNADPWKFEDSPYEQARYAVTLRALKGHHYSRVFEPGCSVGVLTQALAGNCDRLEAIDISPTAVFRAQHRCHDLPNVRIRCGSLPEAIPLGKFDLIVFSEIGYYSSVESWKRSFNGCLKNSILAQRSLLSIGSEHLLTISSVEMRCMR
jgi:SAM-dependent methyltransferase